MMSRTPPPGPLPEAERGSGGGVFETGINSPAQRPRSCRAIGVSYPDGAVFHPCPVPFPWWRMTPADLRKALPQFQQLVRRFAPLLGDDARPARAEAYLRGLLLDNDDNKTA